MWPHSRFPEQNLKSVVEEKMREPYADMIIQFSANDISNLDLLEDQDLKLRLAERSTRNTVNVAKAALPRTNP